MTKWKLGFALALVGMLAISCAGTTQMAESWMDPAYTPQPVTKFMVVGLGESPRRINSFEEVMAAHFGARKLDVVMGSSVKTNEAKDIDTFKNIVKDSGVQMVSISRLVDVTTEQVYTPGMTTYVPAGGYYGMGPYWHSSYMAVSDPGYISESKTYKVETNVYDVKSEKLVWSGLSHTTDPGDYQEAINQIAAAVVGELVKRKLIP